MSRSACVSTVARYLTADDLFDSPVPSKSFEEARRAFLLGCYVEKSWVYYSNDFLLSSGYTQEEIDDARSSAEPVDVSKVQIAPHLGLW